jgi:hypothetical protein
MYVKPILIGMRILKGRPILRAGERFPNPALSWSEAEIRAPQMARAKSIFDVIYKERKPFSVDE